MPSSMESSDSKDSSLMPARILVVYDATKERTYQEFKHTIHSIRMWGGIINSGDTITMLGVLHKVLHPMGYQMHLFPEHFLGTTHIRAMQEEVSKKVDTYMSMLQHSAEECEGEGVDIEVKITAGSPMRKVVAQEVATSNATWVILDRHLRREVKSYLKSISCKVALVMDNFSLDILRPYNSDKDIENIEGVEFYSISKTVPLPSGPDNERTEQASTSSNYYASVSMGCSDTTKSSLFTSSSKWDSFSSLDQPSFNSQKELGIEKQRRKYTRKISSDAPILCITCGMQTELEKLRYSYSEIQLATDDFSPDNLLGEGGYGHVYKGELKNGQLIAAKVRKEKSTQGFAEFQSEVHVLSFARHKNIVMLLGFCCKESLNILVYEYICNQSLEWHLFGNTDHVLEWHRRHAIAIGTAKGLRFLHEECRGSPIIHRDIRPSNILLTHDFVPMLGDFGLAKWKLTEDDIHTKILGTLGYLAPEYAENGIVSVRTDVYAFGIILIQLISGRKPVDPERADQQLSLRQWALPLIQTLALHELVDPRLEDSYNTYELYQMAKTAYLCVQSVPEMRPSMTEVLRLLEGESYRFDQLTNQFIPHYSR